MNSLVQWLASFVHNALTWLYNMVIDVIQYLLDTVAIDIMVIVSFFPVVEFPAMTMVKPDGTVFSIFISTINWMFPIAYLILIATFFMAAISAYVLIAPLARWAKLLT